MPSAESHPPLRAQNRARPGPVLRLLGWLFGLAALAAVVFCAGFVWFVARLPAAEAAVTEKADGIVNLVIDDPSQSTNTMNQAYGESMERAVSQLVDDIAGRDAPLATRTTCWASCAGRRCSRATAASQASTAPRSGTR